MISLENIVVVCDNKVSRFPKARVGKDKKNKLILRQIVHSKIFRVRLSTPL